MKNIVMLITDTFRYDNLGDRAERAVRTPYLDRFLEERATSVEGCYTGSFPTIPHRTDVATGTLGWPHYGWQAIDLSSPNHIAALLGQAGYFSQLICDCPHLFKARFQGDFTAAFHIRGQEGDKPLLHLNDPIEAVVPDEKTRARPRFRGQGLASTHRRTNRYYRYETETFPARTGSTAVRWLEENYKADPFFLWVDFFDPHEPWDPPEYLVARYDPDYDGVPMIHPNYGPSSAFTPAELKNLWSHYAAEAELIDRWIGRILEKLDDLGLWDDTIVLITSDHGMSIGEHGRTGKSNIHEGDPGYWPIYPEIGHVPCLFAGGEVPVGTSRDILVQPIDFLPTLCDLASAPLNPPVPFDGQSLAEAVVHGGDSPRDYVVSGTHIVPNSSGEPPRRRPTPFLVTKDWGYAPVGESGRQELYDIKSDPLATNNVSSGNEETMNELAGLFLDHLKEHGVDENLFDFWRSAGGDGGKWAIDYPD